jgi:hypothetical protein
MRRLLAAICTTCALTAACDGENSVRISNAASDSEPSGVLKVVDALQCPETMGMLTRKGSARDSGRTCLYSGPRGAVVSLQLVSLDGQSANDVLNQFRETLSADMPHSSANLKASAAAADARAAAEAASVDADAARIDAEAASVAADVASGDEARVRAPGVAIDARGDHATVRLPGLSVNAEGDKASVRFGGFSINTDNSTETVDISSDDQTISVQAHDDAAEITTRAPGDAIRATYRLTDDTPADRGWRMVGYEARGPVGGPIVIATVHAKDRDQNVLFDAARDLVTLNVGE